LISTSKLDRLHVLPRCQRPISLFFSQSKEPLRPRPQPSSFMTTRLLQRLNLSSKQAFAKFCLPKVAFALLRISHVAGDCTFTSHVMFLIRKVAFCVDTRKFASPWVSRTFPRTPKNVQAPEIAGQGRIPPLPFAPKMVPSQNQNRAEMSCGPIRQGGATPLCHAMCDYHAVGSM
jgi:hypothetical protein